MATFSFQSNQIHPPLQMLRRKKGVKSKIWACRSLNIGLLPCDSEYVSRTAASFQVVALNLSNLGNTCCLSKTETYISFQDINIYRGTEPFLEPFLLPIIVGLWVFCSSSHIGLIQFAWLSESRIAETHLQFSIQRKREISGNNGNSQKEPIDKIQMFPVVPLFSFQLLIIIVIYQWLMCWTTPTTA